MRALFAVALGLLAGCPGSPADPSHTPPSAASATAQPGSSTATGADGSSPAESGTPSVGTAETAALRGTGATRETGDTAPATPSPTGSETGAGTDTSSSHTGDPDTSTSHTADTGPGTSTDHTGDTAAVAHTGDTGGFFEPTCGRIEKMLPLAATADDKGRAMEGTPDGGFVIGGEFGGSFTLALPGGDVTTRAVAGNDGYVVPFDPDGDPRWVGHISSFGMTEVLDVAGTSDGRIVAVGTMGSLSRVARGRPDEITLEYRDTGSGQDGFAVLFDRDGTALWGTTFGGESRVRDTVVAIGEDGAVYVAADYVASRELELGPPGAGHRMPLAEESENVFLTRLEADTGEISWVRILGGLGDQIAGGAVEVSGGLVVVGGTFTSEITFSQGEPDELLVESGDPYGRRKVFLGAYTSDGRLAWQRTPGTVEGNDGVERLVGHRAGFTLVGRSGNGGLFGEGEPTEFRFGDGFFGYAADYGGDGAFRAMFQVPQQNVQSSASVNGADIRESDRTVAVGGVLPGTHVFGEGKGAVTYMAEGSNDPFTALYDGDGQFRCLLLGRASSELLGNAVQATWFDGQGRLWVMGHFLGRLTLEEGTRDEQTLYSGGWDTFLLRYSLNE